MKYFFSLLIFFFSISFLTAQDSSSKEDFLLGKWIGKIKETKISYEFFSDSSVGWGISKIEANDEQVIMAKYIIDLSAAPYKLIINNFKDPGLGLLAFYGAVEILDDTTFKLIAEKVVFEEDGEDYPPEDEATIIFYKEK